MIERLLILATFVFFIVLTPILILNYYYCRLTAKKCPKCGEKWNTELVGEWDCEMWECWECGNYWEDTY